MLYQKDGPTQYRESQSIQSLVTRWFAANPDATRRNPVCRNALSKYLCVSAMPPCDEHSAWCSGVFYPCKSMCNETLHACFPSGDASLEQGGFNWLQCNALPVTDEMANKDDGHSASNNGNGTALIPVPNECCITSKWNKDKLLPDARKEMCSGGGTTRTLQPNGSYTYVRKPAKVGIKEACSAAVNISPKLWFVVAAVAATALQHIMV